jgi:hypothetical protein
VLSTVSIHAFRDELGKIAATRSVKEWRASQGAGDTGTAGAIAGASHQLGLKPRYLKDVSTGGEEAGVDLMMGHRTGPTGESNQGGLLARKLYKPDSLVSQAEFTPQLLQQKQTMTDSARAISTQAKAMVPAMYGHDTMNAGTPLQRSTSFHEYVPGISDLRGEKMPALTTGAASPAARRAAALSPSSSPGAPQSGAMTYSRPRAAQAADISNVKSTVLDPMAAKGMTMNDTVRQQTSGGLGTNFGNVVNSPQGPKVTDFLPSMEGHANPAVESMKKYAPIHGPSKFTQQEGGPPVNMGALRKEVFKPTMQSNEASYQDRVMGHMSVGAPPPTPPPGQSIGSGRPAGWMPRAQPAAAPQALRGAIHADPFPSSGTSGFLHGAGAVTKGFFNRAAAHL